MSLLAWFSIIICFIGVIAVAVGSYLAYNDRNDPNSSRWAFIITLSGSIAFFLGWLLYGVYLFFSKGLDLNMEAMKQLRGIAPDPEAVRKLVVENSDERFARFISQE